MKRHLDSVDGVSSIFHYDETTDESTIESVQDVEPIVEANKAAQNWNDGYSPSRDLRRVASIPFVVFEGWLKDDGLTWWGYHNNLTRQERAAYRARKLLEHTAWRTSPGAI